MENGSAQSARIVELERQTVELVHLLRRFITLVGGINARLYATDPDGYAELNAELDTLHEDFNAVWPPH